VRNLLLTTAALCVASLACLALPASAQQTVTFLCAAPAGHVCQFAVQSAGSQVAFALPSGQRKEVPGITPQLKEMQGLFKTVAAENNVFPLDNSGFSRLLTPRPSATAGKTEFTYVGENTGIPVGNAPSILDRDYTITADITVPEGGAEGMIVTLGGRFGGYGLYLLHGKPVFD
jgi:hypothetical protein